MGSQVPVNGPTGHVVVADRFMETTLLAEPALASPPNCFFKSVDLLYKQAQNRFV